MRAVVASASWTPFSSSEMWVKEALETEKQNVPFGMQTKLVDDGADGAVEHSLKGAREADSGLRGGCGTMLSRVDKVSHCQ